jgi:L-threonylcarbamoyladenylate synthase
MSTIFNCTESEIENAALALIEGHLVAFPTETVYGLGADATNQKAVTRIYEVKGRPKNHPIIVHISSLEVLCTWAVDIPEYALELATAFWPGPMTLLLNRTSLVGDFITGGQEKVGIRIPSHALANALLKEFESKGGLGIAAPSANRFSKVSPTNPLDVSEELSNFLSPNDLILNGGQCDIGLESTIIDCTERGPIILRPGAITDKMIESKLNLSILSKKANNYDNKIRTSGLLQVHYSPEAKVFLSGTPKYGDGFIALSNFDTPQGAVRLASPSNNQEYAKLLYNALRKADQSQIKNIFIIPPKGEGIALAIRDRLNKCAGLKG